LFQYADFLYWFHCTKDEAIGASYNNTKINVKQLSISNTSYTAKRENPDDDMPENLWIGLRDHGVQPVNTDVGDRILYAEESISNDHWSLPIIASDGGMCVWVRRSTNNPVVIAFGGPRGMGAVSFDRELAQYLDGGPRFFDISKNGGFTLVVVMKFTGTGTVYDHVIDFQDPQSGNKIMLYRNVNTSNLLFEIVNGNSSCVVTTFPVIV